MQASWPAGTATHTETVTNTNAPLPRRGYTLPAAQPPPSTAEQEQRERVQQVAWQIHSTPSIENVVAYMELRERGVPMMAFVAPALAEGEAQLCGRVDQLTAFVASKQRQSHEPAAHRADVLGASGVDGPALSRLAAITQATGDIDAELRGFEDKFRAIGAGLPVELERQRQADEEVRQRTGLLAAADAEAAGNEERLVARLRQLATERETARAVAAGLDGIAGELARDTQRQGERREAIARAATTLQAGEARLQEWRAGISAQQAALPALQAHVAAAEKQIEQAKQQQATWQRTLQS